MAMGSGLLALAMLAAQGPSCEPEGATTFQVRVLTLDGLGWRTSSYHRLQPVARQGTSTVWTADRALVVSLAERARSTSNFGKIISTGDATLSRCEAVNYVAAVERFADGPINQSSAIAFLPRPERLDERFAVKLSGRKLDQGTLVQVALEETHVDVIHEVPQTESLLPSTSKAARSATEITRDLINVFQPQAPRECPQSITCKVQVPEVSQAKVEGEWLIPSNGVLLVSLGVKTVADDQGKAVVRERVAVIEASPGLMPSSTQLSRVEPSRINPAPAPRLAMPALPSRSLPQPMSPEGDIVEGELPPLPEGLASAELDRIKPAPYQPSPQAPVVPGPGRDTELARTSYDAVTSTEKANAAASADVDFARPGSSIVPFLLDRVIRCLEEAGVNIDVDVQGFSTLPRPVQPACEKCDGDDANCPAEARSARVEAAPGGLKLAPKASAQLRVLLKDPMGDLIFAGPANLNEAFKTPGRSETTLIPLGGNVSLEIKATVVTASPGDADISTAKQPGAPTSRR